jgi:predicted aminopeptidase
MVRMVTETPACGASDRGGAARVVRSFRVLLLGAACALLSGCATPYLLQAASGQWQLLHRRVPIDSVLADPHTPPALRAHLEEVRAAREFASRELHLPDNASYRSYADIGRPYVVWNVVAAPEFSVEPKRWCFPVAGCVAYRGYFRERRAREFAARLAVRGFDVAVDGVPAYSTLGRFADPVLSSMLRYGDDELAGTIFHELAHQLLYVRDDSEFNEAFATTVEDEGLERWLEHQGATERLRQLRERQADAAAFAGLMAQARARLARLYASDAPRDEMRMHKAAAFATLAADMRALEHQQGVSYPLYEEWIAEGLNNARLASVSTYFGCLPGFRRVLAESGNDLTRFYAAVRELARAPRAQRHARLCNPPVA